MAPSKLSFEFIAQNFIKKFVIFILFSANEQQSNNNIKNILAEIGGTVTQRK